MHSNFTLIGVLVIQALVVFGSDSDLEIYCKIMDGLKARNIKAELRICSAHRTPERLERMLRESDADIFVAGAGLSAALPGVVASHTIKPVIGIPVSGNYSGLDALLSVHQIPGGIAVLGVGVDNSEGACNAVELALKKYKSVKLLNTLGESEEITKRLFKGINVLEELGAEFQLVEDLGLDFDETKELVINLHPLGEKLLERKGAFAINVPMKEGSTEKDALTLLRQSRQGLWVGLNRVENACIAAVQVLNIGFSGFSRKLNEYRESQRQKVLEADEKERKR
jgi:5-(carboxyamino)imidazole ribonucleotide mutase